MEISTKKIIKTLAVLAFLLTVLSLIGQFYKYFCGSDRYLVSVFNLDEEWNIPSLYATFILFLCSILLMCITKFKTKNGDKFSMHWRILAFIFMIMSMDETLQFHEQTNQPLRYLLGTSGIFYFSWVIPAIFLLIVFIAFYMKFLFALPQNTRNLFISAGVIYVLGAVGLEVIGSYIISSLGQHNLVYGLIANIEEVFEMAGVLIFIYALLKYIEQNISEISLRFVN